MFSKTPYDIGIFFSKRKVDTSLNHNEAFFEDKDDSYVLPFSNSPFSTVT